MKRGFVPCLAMLLIALVSPVSAAQAPEEILKAVVKIRAVVPNDAFTAATLGTEREGSGVVIDSKGHILTIGYLIIEAETIEVFGPEGKPIPATFVGYDHQTGFGILRAEKLPAVEPMKLGDSAKVSEGEPVLVAGHGGSSAVQAARVLSRKEFAGFWEYLLEKAIYTIPAYSNYGGAALINRDGQLLGIGSLYTQLLIQGLGSIPSNIFVPIDLLKPILKDLIEKGRPRKAPQPWLGINVEEAHGRVFITKVTPGGPAEKAGVRPGDLVLSVKGKAVENLADLYRKVWALGDSGVDVSLSVLQGIQIREITVRSADRHQFLELLGRQETKSLLDTVSESHPKVVEELVPKILSLGEVQKVLQNLLKERVSIRDMVSILETLADFAPLTKNPGILTEYCRQALGRWLCKPYQSDRNELHVLTVNPEIEKSISDGIVHTEQGSYLALEPRQAKDIMSRFRRAMEATGPGSPVVLCSPNVRMYVRQLLDRFLPNAAILSHSEIPPNVRVVSMGMVS